MKIIFRFLILFFMISLNAHAQNLNGNLDINEENQLLRNSFTVALKQGSEFEDHLPNNVGSNQRFRSICLNDSIYHWDLDTSTNDWTVISKDVNLVYDVNSNLLSYSSQFWDGAEWTDSIRYTNTYNSNNDLTSAITEVLSNGTWEKTYKESFAYDANFNKTFQCRVGWNNGTLTDSSFSNYTYDANNNKISEIAQYYDGTAISNDYKNLYTYNAYNFLSVLTYYSGFETTWYNSSQYSFNYDSFYNLSTTLEETWNGSAWDNSYLSTYTYTASGKMSSQFDQKWNNGAWENDYLSESNFDSNNNLTETTTQNWSNGNWMNEYLFTFTHDSLNNQTSFLFQKWINNIWENYRFETYEYDENKNKIKENRVLWDSTQWINIYDQTYLYNASGNILSDAYKHWDYLGIDFNYGDSTYYYFYSGDVWPGDANNDTIVNNNDLLTVGLYYSSAGIARDSVSNLWIAHQSQEWPCLQSNLNNMKHADCNGDGIVNELDTIAINMNYGSSVGNKKMNPNKIKSAATLSIIPQSTFYTAGDTARFDVMAGDAANPIDALYGLAFDMQANPSFIKSGTLKYKHISSWMGDPSTNALSITKPFELQGIVENAIVRFDHLNQNGYGKIGELEFVIDPNYPVIDTLNIFISYCFAVNESGNNVPLSTNDSSVIVYPISTYLNEQFNTSILIFPNPATGELFLLTRTPSTIEIFDMQGKTIMTTENYDGNTRIDLSGLTRGMYTVKIKTKNELVFKKFIKN